MSLWRSRTQPGQAVAEPEILPDRDPDLLEVYTLRAVARLDAALGAYRNNRMLPQSTLVDALLDVRSSLSTGLGGAV